MFGENLLCFRLCPLLFILSLSTTEKSLTLSSLYSPFWHLHILTSVSDPQPSITTSLSSGQDSPISSLFLHRRDVPVSSLSLLLRCELHLGESLLIIPDDFITRHVSIICLLHHTFIYICLLIIY